MFKETKKKIFKNFILKELILLNQEMNSKTFNLIFVHYLAKEKKEENNYLIVDNYTKYLDDFVDNYRKKLQLILLKKESVLFGLIDSNLFLDTFNEYSKASFNEMCDFVDQQVHQANCWLEETHQEQYPFYWEKVN